MKYNKNIGFSCFAVLMFMFSCMEQKENVPKDIIDQDIMSEILLGINISENLIQKRNPMDSVQEAQRHADLKMILGKYKIADSTFYKSYNYYATHPELLKLTLEKGIEKVEQDLKKHADTIPRS